MRYARDYLPRSVKVTSFPRKRESASWTSVHPRPSTSSGQALSRRDECRGSHHHGFAARPMDT